MSNKYNYSRLKHTWGLRGEKYEILPGIDVILYINLDKRQDRRARFECEFRKIGVDPVKLRRISAVDTPKNGALGCLTSHINACRVAIEEYPGKNVLICEDDIVFQKSGEEIRGMLSSFRHDSNFEGGYDVVMLAHNTHRSSPTNIPGIIKIIDSQTASAYLANTSYLEKLVNVYEEALKSFNIDHVWKEEYWNDQCWKVLQKQDTWYGFVPRIAIQGESYSDIEKKVVKYGV